MLRPLATHLVRPQRAVVAAALSSLHSPSAAAAVEVASCQHMRPVRCLSSVPSTADDEASSTSSGAATSTAAREQMPYFHFNRHEKPKPKFKSPRKRASKLFAELNDEAVQISKEGNPAVFNVPFAVGDAIEITSVNQGGVASTDVEKLRGVVLGKTSRGLASSVIIRDVVMGEPIERKVMLHSPLLKSLKVIEENFVYKGKRKVKRAKLYFLRDRKPEETRVTKW
mmetsp:Transcript_5145/g.9879  ORF Transcript_5145/g.9879 Transcript_5145/m.9879 type:complete len:226 (-) Transcript_5145:658-1335(-)